MADRTIVREIEAKTLATRVPTSDDSFWYRTDFSINVYRGCQHRCIYCDSRSACYGIDRFDEEVLVKRNAVELLEEELARKRKKGVIGTGSMSDPYMPLERSLGMTRRCLDVIYRYGFGVHVHTKSDLVVRDAELLGKIHRVNGHAVVAMTVTTTDDELAAKLEPRAPVPSQRFAALRSLASAGVETWVTLMPVLPFIEDSEEEILQIVRASSDAGVHGILPFLGVTMRNRQRAYFYAQLDRMFPGVRLQYARAFGECYVCKVPEHDRLLAAFRSACHDAGMKTNPARPPGPDAGGVQLPLL